MGIRVGDAATVVRQLTATDVRVFADVSGDHNPIHLDEGVAAASVFGRCIVHGMLPLSMISALLGQRLPGPGTIYLAQDVRFRRPIYVNDLVKASVVITEIDEARRRVRLKTTVSVDDGDIAIDGEAVVLVPESALR